MPIGVIPAASAFFLQGFLSLSVSLPAPLPSPEFWPAAVHSPFRAHVTDPLRGCQLPIVLGASPAFLWLRRGNARGLAPTSSEMLGLLVTSTPGSFWDIGRISPDPSASHTKHTCWMQRWKLTRPLCFGLTLSQPNISYLSLQSTSTQLRSPTLPSIPKPASIHTGFHTLSYAHSCLTLPLLCRLGTEPHPGNLHDKKKQNVLDEGCP